ncbi:hypothetical protein MSG28_007886 [Choristoneura fumiferana]|uniref:Uncharacterized protein n=1 Tax=Choristoneura fumiferana TaxID=7141 RepID=A0ACC0J9E9_CHOFU|nr:hypothetical protein MSG28_007886 [Choristoneura fumiferana]
MATLNSNISLLVVTPGIYQVQPAAEGLFRSEFYVQIQLWPAHHERGAPILRCEAKYLNLQYTRIYMFTIDLKSFSFEKHQNRLHYEVGHLNEIPKRFELKGNNAVTQFQKYVNDINDLTLKDNMTVKYKVKVEVIKPRKLNSKKIKRVNSKKYKVPLKKKSMMLSSFEVMQRKLVEEKHRTKKHNIDEIILPTTKFVPIPTTKIPNSGKYKPIINKVMGNFSRAPIRPVRNKIITLTR